MLSYSSNLSPQKQKLRKIQRHAIRVPSSSTMKGLRGNQIMRRLLNHPEICPSLLLTVIQLSQDSIRRKAVRHLVSGCNNRFSMLVLNTGNFKEGGKHWIAVSYDKIKNVATFFDSLGGDAPKSVKRVLQSIQGMTGSRIVMSRKKRQRDESSTCGNWVVKFGKSLGNLQTL